MCLPKYLMAKLGVLSALAEQDPDQFNRIFDYFKQQRFDASFADNLKSMLKRMLMVDPAERATSDEIISHPFFKSIRESADASADVAAVSSATSQP
jgi:serine/threonine protein kinase